MRRLLLAAGGAALAAATAPLAAAEPPVRVAQAAAVPFAIPPQSLAAALVAFGRQAGLQVSFDPAVAQGRSSPGVTGTHLPEQALRQLLGGTGAVGRFEGGGTVVVERVARAGDGGLVLNPITVEGEAGAPPTATIGNLPEAYAGGQVARGGRAGLLGNRDAFDTPFNTRSYTDKLIRDQQARTISDVLLNDASVRSNVPRNGINDQFFVRGFPVFQGDFQFDGLPGLLPTRKFGLESTERVELIKGPNALLNGAASSIGGSVNLVPKRALERPLTRLAGRYLSDEQGEAQFDVGRRFGRDGAFGARFNGVHRDGETPVDNHTERLGLTALALDYRGERLRTTLDAGLQRFDLDAPRVLLFANPGFAIPDAPDSDANPAQDWESTETRRHYVVVGAEYDLLPTWTASLRYGYSRFTENIVITNPSIIDEDGTITDTPGFFPSEAVVNVPEATLRGDFATGPVGHKLAATAVQVRSKRGVNTDFAALGEPIVSNLYDPVSVPSRSTAGLARHPPTTSRDKLTSFALADTVSMLDERVQVTVGARQQRIESRSYTSDTRERTGDYDDSELTPAIGLLVKPWSSVSLYANYIEALQQGATAPIEATNAGEVFPPFVSEQYEVGLKWDLGTFGLTAALFQIEQPSEFVDPATLEFDVDGEQRNRGVELEAFGEPVDGFRLLGGLAFTDGELTKTEGGENDGNDAPGVPKVQLNLGAEWDVPWLTGLTVGGRSIYTSSQKYDAANTQQIPSWWRFDVGARYAFEAAGRPLVARFNVENVADDDYWESTGRGILSVGAPRTFLFSITADF